jgi:hypothetical protein
MCERSEHIVTLELPQAQAEEVKKRALAPTSTLNNKYLPQTKAETQSKLNYVLSKKPALSCPQGGHFSYQKSIVIQTKICYNQT